MRLFRFLILTFALAACAFHQGNDSSTLSLPKHWHALSTGSESRVTAAKASPKEAAAEKEWWKLFHDATLEALIAKAESHSLDLKAAGARLREARAMRVAARAALFPQVDASGNATRGNEENFFNGKPFSLYEAGFDASWEVDIFGSERRRAESAAAEAGARRAEFRGALISLRAEIARDYIDLRAALQRLKVAEAAVGAERQALALTRSQHESGLVSGLDEAEAEGQYQTTESRVPALQSEAEADKQQIAVLSGLPLSRLGINLDAPGPIPEAEARVALATPASVIAHRPDVAAAGHALASAAALKSAAIADLYPQISLSATLGTGYSSFVGPEQKLWSLGASLTEPIFNAGKLRAEVNAADARQQQALFAYEKTELQAQAEVETDLAAYVNAEKERQSLAGAQQAAEANERLADERYRAGLSPFLDVLQAQAALYNAQTASISAAANASVDQVKLWKALGL